VLEAAPGKLLRLSRPYDAGEDAQHAAGLSVLLDALPRSPPRRALSFRCGYGALPLALRVRYPEARVAGQERDLLDAAFARRNAQALGLSGPRLEIYEALWPREALSLLGGAADLVVGELSSSAGEAVSALELRQAADGLSPSGQALILASARQEREWFPAALPKKITASALVRRAGFTLLRLAPPARG
jgi:SAM-dependent methyltransferase